MVIHTVFFWLKPDLTEEQKDAFAAGIETLYDIEDADDVFIGTPADTPKRDVIDDSYDVGLTVLLEDVAAHDRYQEHPLHKAFVETFKPYWDRVLVFDFEEPPLEEEEEE
jgi:hypothetical protein